MTSPSARYVLDRSYSLARAAALVLVSTLGASGCNFIFNPVNSDDVIRCKNTTECEQQETFRDALNTGRLDAACTAPGSGGGDFTTSKTNQVCSVTDKASVSCGIDNLPAGAYQDALDAAAADNNALYSVCPNDKRGTLGCPARADGSCDSGLESNVFKTCDDGSGEHPLYAPSDADSFIQQDVRDQHCRSFFCDSEFVCNSNTQKCQRCNDSITDAKGLGRGACAELALAGARSTVYQSQDELVSSCPDTSKFETTQFGPPVAVAP